MTLPSLPKELSKLPSELQPANAKLDPYEILEKIERLNACTNRTRNEFEEIVESRNRYSGLTAEGVIVDCGCMLQWD